MKLLKTNTFALLLFFSNIIITGETPKFAVCCSEKDSSEVIKMFSQLGYSRYKKTIMPVTTEKAHTQDLTHIPASLRADFQARTNNKRNNWRDKKIYQPLLGVSAQKDQYFQQAQAEFRREREESPLSHNEQLYTLEQLKLQLEEKKQQQEIVFKKYF